VQFLSWVYCWVVVKTLNGGCPDGSVVGRDAANGCQFPACPTNVDETTTVDGTWVSCPPDAKMRPDGSYAVRDAANGCQFHACSSEVDSSSVQPTTLWQLFVPSVMGLSLLA